MFIPTALAAPVPVNKRYMGACRFGCFFADPAEDASTPVSSFLPHTDPHLIYNASRSLLPSHLLRHPHPSKTPSPKSSKSSSQFHRPRPSRALRRIQVTCSMRCRCWLEVRIPKNRRLHLLFLWRSSIWTYRLLVIWIRIRIRMWSLKVLGVGACLICWRVLFP